MARTQAVYYRTSDGSEPVNDFIDDLDERKQAAVDLQIDAAHDPQGHRQTARGRRHHSREALEGLQGQDGRPAPPPATRSRARRTMTQLRNIAKVMVVDADPDSEEPS
jgi:hypothetical protein